MFHFEKLFSIILINLSEEIFMGKMTFVNFDEISNELTPLELKLLVVELNDRFLKKLDENVILIIEN
jgi:hypothetical protein